MVGTTPSTCTTDGTHLLPVSHWSCGSL
jgi:hypothetical protein